MQMFTFNKLEICSTRAVCVSILDVEGTLQSSSNLCMQEYTRELVHARIQGLVYTGIVKMLTW